MPMYKQVIIRYPFVTNCHNWIVNCWLINTLALITTILQTFGKILVIKRRVKKKKRDMTVLNRACYFFNSRNSEKILFLLSFILPWINRIGTFLIKTSNDLPKYSTQAHVLWNQLINKLVKNKDTEIGADKKRIKCKKKKFGYLLLVQI